MMKQISGFSKLTKEEKISWLSKTYFKDAEAAERQLRLYWNRDEQLQRLHDEFSENTLSNYYLPFGVAPNFVINGKTFVIPMAIEESSVVAAASKAAKFWGNKGGFKAEVKGVLKSGQVHLIYQGDSRVLSDFFEEVKPKLEDSIATITANMEKRGGGLRGIRLVDKTASMKDYYQLDCNFDTVDAMGANFINSCLEQIAETFEELSLKSGKFEDSPLEVVMSILSNYVPECRVYAEVSCPVEELFEDAEKSWEFADRFVQAIEIAKAEPKRAVTHNKGVMNGIDAVVLATGNDFRAVEACAHAYAARNGSYSSLTSAEIVAGQFRFWIEIPLALGTVGGLTSLHPLVKLALEMLQYPNARELMEITAVVGLAQNFGAVQSLITTGIQEGHMKMHLMNILNQFEATKAERIRIIEHFKYDVVSYNAVLRELNKIRTKK